MVYFRSAHIIITILKINKIEIYKNYEILFLIRTSLVINENYFLSGEKHMPEFPQLLRKILPE